MADCNEFLRALAKEKKCRLGDLNAEMQVTDAETKKSNPLPAGRNYLTTDGVHRAAAGDCMMALGVLKGFGLSPDQLEKARAVWDVK